MKKVLVEVDVPDDFFLDDLRVGYEKRGQFVTDVYYLDHALVETAQEPVSLRFPTMLRKMWSGGEVQKWLDEQGPLFAHLEREGWMPIETAPVDEPIQLGKWHEDGGWYWIASGYLVGDGIIWCDIHDGELTYSHSAGFRQPTHWKLMSAAPTGKGGV